MSRRVLKWCAEESIGSAIYYYAVAPDGKSFVLARPVLSRDARGLYVVLNWFAARGAAR